MEGIDSNILIYAFDESSRFHKVALNFVEEKIKTTILGIAEFSLLKFYSVLTDERKIGILLAIFNNMNGECYARTDL